MKVKGFLFGTACGTLMGAAAAVGVRYALDNWLQEEIRGYLDLIDLTDDQKRRVEEIRGNFLPQVEGIRQALRDRRQELADLIFAEPFEHALVDAAVEKISGLQLKLEQAVIDHIIQERDLLTPDQQRQFHGVILQQFQGGGLGVHDVGGRR